MPDFKQVDVFTNKKYKGNPVAVFFDADDLTAEQMGEMSAWTNLSEATFVQKPSLEGADYRVRIYAMDEELPFAGHPTIGTCFALLESGIIKPTNGRIVQQCKAGLVNLNVQDKAIQLQLPYARSTVVTEAQKDLVSASLDAPQALGSQIYDVGPIWLVIKLPNAEAVLRLEPDFSKIQRVSAQLGVTGLQVIGKHEDRVYESRTFCPLVGTNEDPVCGSGSGASAAYLRDVRGILGSVLLKQGTRLKREGRATIECGPHIYVKGEAVITISGSY